MQIFSKRTLERLRETVRRVLDSPPGGQPGPGLSGRPVRQQHPWFRIETNEANGKYTLWRQQWDTATGKLKDWPANRPFTGPLKVYTPEVGYEKNAVATLIKDMIVRGGYSVQLQTDYDIPAVEVISFEAPATCWGEAYENWTDAAPAVGYTDLYYVRVHPCLDAGGSGVVVGTNIIVGLPRYGTLGPDPNVVSGDVIQFSYDRNGQAVAAQDYSDGKIADIIAFSGDPASIRAGWQLCDGTNDPKGAAVPDLRGHFLVGYHSAGGKKLNAADSADYYKAIGETGGYDLHGKSENNHPDHADHNHSIDLTVQAQSGTGVIIPRYCWTGGMLDICSHSAIIYKHGGIMHAWTESGLEEHDFNDTDNRPLYYVLAWIVRVDNSL